MPTMANITVKKADGTTDVLYTAMTGSAGDKSPAVWRNKTVGTTPAQQPELLLSSESSGNGTARRIRIKGKWPMVKTDAGGNIVVAGGADLEATLTLPRNQVPADQSEFIYQFTNLLSSALVRSSMTDGYAPR